MKKYKLMEDQKGRKFKYSWTHAENKFGKDTIYNYSLRMSNEEHKLFKKINIYNQMAQVLMGYDANGAILNGKGQYKIHFPAGKTPPVNAFWSLTMYNKRGFLVNNSIKRYTIGDRDNLIYISKLYVILGRRYKICLVILNIFQRHRLAR